MARYHVWYTDPEGAKLAYLEPISLEYALVYSDVGVCRIDLPKDETAAYWPVAVDNQIHIYRTPYGGTAELQGIFFARGWRRYTTREGLSRVTVTGVNANDLLNRRIVAYYAGSSEAQMSNEADDMMKQIVTDNLVDGTDYAGSESGRDISDHGFSVAQATAEGPTIEQGHSWRNVLSVLQSIQSKSRAAGTEVFFNVEATSAQTFTFQTYTGQPGSDRTLSSSDDPLLFAPSWGNLEDPVLDEDYTDEANFIYAGGQGEGDQRNIQEASDTARINASVWNRREAFRQATHGASTDAAVGDQADEELARLRGQVMFSAQIVPTADTPYGGRGWRIGDKVTCSYLGRQFDCLIRSGYITVDERGREDVRARVESV